VGIEGVVSRGGTPLPQWEQRAALFISICKRSDSTSHSFANLECIYNFLFVLSAATDDTGCGDKRVHGRQAGGESIKKRSQEVCHQFVYLSARFDYSAGNPEFFTFRLIVFYHLNFMAFQLSGKVKAT